MTEADRYGGADKYVISGEKRSCDKFHHYLRSLFHQPNHEKHFQEEDGWCGPAALQYVARCCGMEYSQSQLARLMGTTNENGTSHKQMLEGAKELGLSTFSVEWFSLDKLSSLLPTHYIIVNWIDGTNEHTDGHYSPLLKVEGNKIYLADATMDRKTFEKKWYDFDNEEKRIDRWAMVVRKNT
jgi:ABC-type bacteriocin/lantibiotic exporter with double-glycine peptidase domain